MCISTSFSYARSQIVDMQKTMYCDITNWVKDQERVSTKVCTNLSHIVQFPVSDNHGHATVSIYHTCNDQKILIHIIII